MLRSGGIRKVIKDLPTHWLTYIIMLKLRPFTLKVTIASMPMSIPPYGYTFITLKGPNRLELSLLGNNFNLELKKRTKLLSRNSHRWICQLCQFFILFIYNFELSQPLERISSRSFNWSNLFSPMSYRLKLRTCWNLLDGKIAASISPLECTSCLLWRAPPLQWESPLDGDEEKWLSHVKNMCTHLPFITWLHINPFVKSTQQVSFKEFPSPQKLPYRWHPLGSNHSQGMGEP